MGGAADLPQRSSSPLKRTASDLDESDVASSQKDDVDMVPVPQSDPPELGDSLEQSPTHRPAQSIGISRDAEQRSVTPATDAQNGMESISSPVLYFANILWS